MNQFDTIILGLGGMGAAAAWACSRRGQRVLGLEQFALGHNVGSSHGHSRIIREAYYEHPAYVPLVRRAYEHWAAIESVIGQTLLTPCNCANIGRARSEIIHGVERAAREHQLPVETWNAANIMEKIPALKVPEDYVALVESRAGWLKVEACVGSMLKLAEQLGAKLHGYEKVEKWSADEHQVTVTTRRGSYVAKQLIVTAGPWAAQVVHDLKLPLRVMRQLQLWFTPPATSASIFRSPQLPIFMVESELGHFYGIPDGAGPGVKIAQHYGAPELTSPGQINRLLQESDLQPVREFLEMFMPSLATAPLVASAACIYTLTPDRHFIIDRHPRHERVAIACGFSGHGFKFAPVVGELLANLTENSRNNESSRLFSISRFLT